MTIKPVPSGPTPRPGARQPVQGKVAPEPRADEASRAPETARPAPGDNVQLSDAVKELHGQISAEAVPSGEIPPDRLADVMDRLAKGHYDRPEVKDQVVGRIADDLDQQ